MSYPSSHERSSLPALSVSLRTYDSANVIEGSRDEIVVMCPSMLGSPLQFLHKDHTRRLGANEVLHLTEASRLALPQGGILIELRCHRSDFQSFAHFNCGVVVDENSLPWAEALPDLCLAQAMKAAVNQAVIGRAEALGLVLRLVANFAHRQLEAAQQRLLEEAIRTDAPAIMDPTLTTESILPASASDERIRRSILYIDLHIGDHLSIGQLADIACMSPSHFSRSFKSQTGHSPHEYVMEKRLQHACALLRTTAWPIASIAEAAGYASHSHLSRHFQTELDTTPSQYRTYQTSDE